MQKVLAILVVLWAAPLRAEPSIDGMIRLTLAGRQVEGLPLAWDEGRVHLLARDGRLWEFSPAAVVDFHKTSSHFQPAVVDFHKTSSHFQGYSVSELRAALLKELGPEFEVTGTGHYLVAHPRHQGDKWAQRFEDLYRSLVHYFSVRGFTPAPPPFPLVGIVCRNQDEFQQQATQAGGYAPGVVGFYAPESNRIVLFDMGSREESAAWQENAAIIVHEAAHQVAFNTGIHSRYAPPPRWVAEGLAMMFEAPGVYDSRNHLGQRERINPGRLTQFRELVSHHQPELIAWLVTSDDVFQSARAAAYAESWALTFYLMENEPRKYARYLAVTASREPFSTYPAEARRADFTAVFGNDWRMLEARFLRFMAGLKYQ
jgi:hypothetical protein